MLGKWLSILYVLLFLGPSYALAKNLPFSFKEDVEFLDKKNRPFLDFGKKDDFAGVIRRSYLANADQRDIDFYDFSRIKAEKMTDVYCRKLAEEVFGPLKEISLKVDSQEKFLSPRSGEVCRMILVDDDKDGLFKERHFYALVYRKKPYGLVGRFKKMAKTEEKEELRDFVKSLKQPQ